jgi:hypothetical protein
VCSACREEALIWRKMFRRIPCGRSKRAVVVEPQWLIATPPREIVMNRLVLGIVTVVVAAVSLSACVESKAPLLTEAKPLLGQQFEVHLYESFVENKASDAHASVYRWSDGAYVRASGLARDVKRFVAEPLNGSDFIIQSTDADNGNFLYWIGRRLTPGAYLIFNIEEKDADEATRKGICGDRDDDRCVVRTHEQLVTLARATAAKPPRNTALGVVLSRPEAF